MLTFTIPFIRLVSLIFRSIAISKPIPVPTVLFPHRYSELYFLIGFLVAYFPYLFLKVDVVMHQFCLEMMNQQILQFHDTDSLFLNETLTKLLYFLVQKQPRFSFYNQ